MEKENFKTVELSMEIASYLILSRTKMTTKPTYKVISKIITNKLKKVISLDD